MAQRTVRLVESWDIESPNTGACTGTGRSTCRICGQKIQRGAPSVWFYHTFADGSYNGWTSVECKAHAECFPASALKHSPNS